MRVKKHDWEIFIYWYETTLHPQPLRGGEQGEGEKEKTIRFLLPSPNLGEGLGVRAIYS